MLATIQVVIRQADRYLRSFHVPATLTWVCLRSASSISAGADPGTVSGLAGIMSLSIVGILAVDILHGDGDDGSGDNDDLYR